jgi:hypothetical protein
VHAQIDGAGAGHRHAARVEPQIAVAHDAVGNGPVCRQRTEIGGVAAPDEALRCVLSERKRIDPLDLAVGEEIERARNIKRADQVVLLLATASKALRIASGMTACCKTLSSDR